MLSTSSRPKAIDIVIRANWGYIWRYKITKF